ncbi:hypothetical protein VNO78_35177 [Psophocarpus tetragonolobus]|uniref:Uncharacterized protein n=1 Tax=Psophocarpus tetragonolobus TaxID=3891 RepID=A0AAN9NSP9_PSOTE
MRVLMEPFSETEMEGTSARSSIPRVAGDEAGPSHQRSVVENASLESSMRNRIARLEQDNSPYLLDKGRGVYWAQLKEELKHASSQRDLFNRLLSQQTPATPRAPALARASFPFHSNGIRPGQTSVRPGRADRFLAPKSEGERDLVSPGIVAAGCRRPDGLGEGGKGLGWRRPQLRVTAREGGSEPSESTASSSGGLSVWSHFRHTRLANGVGIRSSFRTSVVRLVEWDAREGQDGVSNRGMRSPGDRTDVLDPSSSHMGPMAEGLTN